MIDIHCHVLWGVDDASQDRETAKKMLQIAVEDGIEAILCTPQDVYKRQIPFCTVSIRATKNIR